MKLPIPCLKCVSGRTPPFPVDIASVEFRDDGRYEITCSKGHTSVTILQEQKFEILFDIGAYAISDGYYREAISSFTSSLERFYEFFIRVVLLEKGLRDGLINESWKTVSNRSERQLGAFIFLYTNDFKKTPELLSNKEIEFRNKVIHQGVIPSKQEAMEYGQKILILIRNILKELKKSYPKGIAQLLIKHIQDGNKGSSTPVSTMTIPTIINLTRSDEDADNRSLEEAIKKLRRVS